MNRLALGELALCWMTAPFRYLRGERKRQMSILPPAKSARKVEQEAECWARKGEQRLVERQEVK